MTKIFGKIFIKDRNTKLIRKTSSNYLRDYRKIGEIFEKWYGGEEISDGDRFTYYQYKFRINEEKYLYLNQVRGEELPYHDNIEKDIKRCLKKTVASAKMEMDLLTD